MSRIKLDLSHFKHVSSDGKSTTLQHKDGHILTMAHKSLSKESQDQLNALPKSKSKDKMAQGGQVTDQYLSQVKANTVPEGVKEAQERKALGMNQNGSTILVNDSKPKSHGKVIKKAEGGDVEPVDEEQDQPAEKANIPTSLDPNAIPGVTDYQAKPISEEELGNMKQEDANRILAEAQKGSPRRDVFENYPSRNTPEAQTEQTLNRAESISANRDQEAMQREAEAKQAQQQQMNQQQRIAALAGKQVQQPQQGQLEPAVPPQAPVQPQQPQAVAPSQPSMGNIGSRRDDLMDPVKVANALHIEDQAWRQDLANGHIKPETYQSLFAKKDTLGKIGTLFGMLASGFGSGMSGQPNAVMHMMDQVIKNDVDAQVQSKNNAQNFLRLEQQHQMNKAQIGHMAMLDQVTAADLAQMKAGRTATHELWRQIQSLPEGPEKQQRLQALGMLTSSLDAKYQDMAANIGSRQALLSGLTNKGQGDESAFASKVQQLRLAGMGPMAEHLEKHHMPGFNQPTNSPVSDKDRDIGMAYNNTLKQLNDAINFKKMHPGASFSLADRAKADTLMSNLGNQIRVAESMGVFKDSEAKLMTKMLGNSPADFLSAASTDPKLKEMMRLKQGEYHNFLNKYGIQPQQSQGQSSPQFDFKPRK